MRRRETDRRMGVWAYRRVAPIAATSSFFLMRTTRPADTPTRRTPIRVPHEGSVLEG